MHLRFTRLVFPDSIAAFTLSTAAAGTHVLQMLSLFFRYLIAIAVGFIPMRPSRIADESSSISASVGLAFARNSATSGARSLRPECTTMRKFPSPSRTDPKSVIALPSMCVVYHPPAVSLSSISTASNSPFWNASWYASPSSCTSSTWKSKPYTRMYPSRAFENWSGLSSHSANFTAPTDGLNSEARCFSSRASTVATASWGARVGSGVKVATGADVCWLDCSPLDVDAAPAGALVGTAVARSPTGIGLSCAGHAAAKRARTIAPTIIDRFLRLTML